MKRKLYLLLLSLILMVSLIIGGTPASANGGTPIYYDDGTDDYWLNPIPGWSDLVLFTPPYTPAKLTQLDFYIWASSTGSYKAIVLDGAGNQIYLSDVQNVAAGTDGWVTIDLSAKSIPITGDFYAGLEFQESDTLSIGCDNRQDAPAVLLFWLCRLSPAV